MSRLERPPFDRVLWLCRGSLGLRGSLCCVSHSHTGSTATTPEQPGTTSLHCHVEEVFVQIVFLWCLAALLVAWTTHGLPSLTALVYRGY